MGIALQFPGWRRQSMYRNLRNASRSGVGELWCRLMHATPMWPSHGHYECRTCGRNYPVPWNGDLQTTSTRHKIGEAMTQPAAPSRSW